MSVLQHTNHSKNYNQRLSYRYFTRQVMNQPMNVDLHTSRIMVAMELEEREPLQGALVDMFYGCWFEVPFFGVRILSQVKDKLHQQTYKALRVYVEKRDYVQTISALATRWSVLVTPSMNVYHHQLRTSADDSYMLANQTVSALLTVLEEDTINQTEQIHAIENEFFSHCKACNDSLAFSIVWWQLAKNGWRFDERWIACRVQLEQTS